MIIPSDLAFSYLIQFAQNNPEEGNTRKLAVKYDAVNKAYKYSGNNTEEAQKALVALSQGNYNEVNRILASIIDKITADIPDLSHDTIHVVGHAHMDMNWLWTFSETKKMTDDNLRQAVAFMNEFDDFRLVQSQAAIYNNIEKEDPRLFEQTIKKYVTEGRLEPVGGMWTEGDQNLTSGEALSRSFYWDKDIL